MAGEQICCPLTFAAFADKRNSNRVSRYELTSSLYLFRQIIVNTFMLKWTAIPYSRPLGSPSNANVLHKQAFRHNTSVSLEKSLHSKSICSRDHSIDFLSSRNVCERSCERHFQISNEDVGSITPFVKLRTSYVGSDLTIWVILPPPLLPAKGHLL